ncbi:MAG TPA: tetratricopeptide repeat protein [Acidobacteriaceae bacterium]|nr:tetratricopeptide repeat protein [Acidobacteriaceae bacterium]
MSRTSLLLLLLLATPVWARDSAPAWIQVRSEHFTVVTDAGEKQGRRAADQFERMRWAFQALFPKMQVDPAAPITVLAVRNGKDLEALEPADYIGKGKLNLAGYFLHTQENNYILLRLDVQNEEHPYATVYHEYTHLELGDAIEWMPLWLNEGLAEFFQNTELEEKTIRLGEASREDLLYLQQNRLIPLETLFRVDPTSPYYHEEQKGSIFYAESWALTHMLETSDVQNHTTRVANYVRLVSQHEDPVTAAQQAFGDLKKLQQELDEYTRRGSYQYFRLNTQPLSEAAFQVTSLPQPQADALRADFLARIGRSQDAHALIDSVLKADPNNVQARETLGYVAFRDGKLDEAKKWYAEAVALDSHSYLAQYYFGALSLMNGDSSGPVEASLLKSIQLNPRFAPACDALASVYARRGDNLDKAYMLMLQAVQLEPANVQYRINEANVLMQQQRYDDAVRVLEAAQPAAKTPEAAGALRLHLQRIRQYRQQVEEAKQRNAEYASQPDVANRPTTIVATGINGQPLRVTIPGKPPAVIHPTEKPHGPMLTARGVIQAVTCSAPTVIEFQLQSATKKVALYNNNYYDVDVTAGNFMPKGELHPCDELEGMKAKVTYFATADKTVDGQIVSIMMFK